MRVVTQRVQGKLLVDNGRYALLLLNQEPEQTADALLYLRFAYVFQGVETPIFPVSLLDDWGNEVEKKALFDWVREFADEFPRAELFGYEWDGTETQCFLRELELMEKLHCYAYTNKNAPLSDGVRVEAVLLADDGVAEVVKIKRPSVVKRPLSLAKLSWYQAPQTITGFTFG